MVFDINWSNKTLTKKLKQQDINLPDTFSLRYIDPPQVQTQIPCMSGGGGGVFPTFDAESKSV